MTSERRRARVWFAFALCLLSATGLGARAHAESASDRPIARPLEDGLHDWVGVAKCKTCHRKEMIGDQYAAWKKDPHSRAYATLSNERSLAIGKELGLTSPPNESPACLRCHVDGYGVAPTRIAKALSKDDGVGCESCHGPGRDYRKKSVMSDAKKSADKGLWDVAKHAGVCEACHNPESPTYDPARYVRPDGTTVGFDFEIAKSRVPHPIPEEVKGRYVELEKAQKEAASKR